MNLYSLHSHPKKLHRHEEADNAILSVFWEKYKNNPKELNKREDIIAKDAKHSYEYAIQVLKDRFPKGEPVIAKNAHLAVYYAMHILKDRFVKAEEAIATNATYARFYSVFVLKKPWPLGEATIAKDSKEANLYLDRFPERKAALEKLKL